MKTAKELTSIIIHALEEKKAEDITVIDISTVSTMADYFVIANGTNTNQVQAMIDSVMDELAKNKVKPRQIEGYRNANWVLLDYQDVIVHVFDKENRLFYDLERIWKDGKTVSLEEF